MESTDAGQSARWFPIKPWEVGLSIEVGIGIRWQAGQELPSDRAMLGPLRSVSLYCAIVVV